MHSESELDDVAGRVDKIAREILHDNFLRLQVSHLRLDEDFLKSQTSVQIALTETSAQGSRSIQIDGIGVGLVDAFFDGMMKAYAKEHCSLEPLSIVDFRVDPRLKGAHGRKTDALAEARLRIRNSENYEYAFVHRTPSVSQSSVGVIQDAFQFFINSERAYIQLHLALEDAQKRKRSDLVEKYQNQMSTLVHATSYLEVVRHLTQVDRKEP